jgi:hypothetical protein
VGVFAFAAAAFVFFLGAAETAAFARGFTLAAAAAAADSSAAALAALVVGLEEADEAAFLAGGAPSSLSSRRSVLSARFLPRDLEPDASGGAGDGDDGGGGSTGGGVDGRGGAGAGGVGGDAPGRGAGIICIEKSAIDFKEMSNVPFILAN